MTLTLPEIRLTEREIKHELALSLYTARKATLVQAGDIAGIAGAGFFEFQGLLRERKIPEHYGGQDLEDDLGNFPRKS